MLSYLLNIPLLSLFLIPSYTPSFSTSLNLLFFYLTWSTLLWSHSALRIEIWGTFIIRALFFLAPSTLFFLFDVLLPSISAGLKRFGERSIVTSRYCKRRWYKVLFVSWLNVAWGIIVQAFVEYYIVEVLGWRRGLRVTRGIDMPAKMLRDVVLCYFGREVVKYFSHRTLLHNRFSPFSKAHIAWTHGVPYLVPLSNHYDHPIPYILGVVLPTFLPAALLNIHILSYFLLVALISLEESFTCSGYKTLPSMLLLGGATRRAEAHHMSGGKGNYGVVGLCDLLGGSSLGTAYIDKKERQRRKDENVNRKQSIQVRPRREVVEEDIQFEDEEEDIGSDPSVEIMGSRRLRSRVVTSSRSVVAPGRASRRTNTRVVSALE